MKIWKKLSLVLCMSLAFSTAAAGCDALFGNSSESFASSSASSSVEDDSSSSVENDSSSNDEDDIATKVNIYLGLMASKLSASKSAKLTFEINNNGVLESGVVQSNTTLKAMSGKAVVSKNANGSFNAIIEATVASLENPLEGEEKTYYLIDDYVYEDVGENTYHKYDEKVIDNAIHSLTQGQYDSLAALYVGLQGMLSGDVSSDLEFEGLEGSFGNVAVLDSGLTDEGAWVTADGTEKATELFTFLGTVDERTTYADLFDFALKQISPELTTEKIFDEMYSHRKGTVGSLVEEFDQKSLEETGKSLQENLDTLLNSTAVKEAIGSALDEETYPGVADMLLGFDIAEFLATDSGLTDDNGGALTYGELSLDRLTQELVQKLVEMLGDQASELIPAELIEKANFATLISVLEAFVDDPAFADLEEGSTLYKLLEQAKTLEVTKADVKAEIDAVDDFNVSMYANFTGMKDSGGTKTAVSATASLVIGEFSSKEAAIALPEGAQIVVVHSACAGCGESKEDVTYRTDGYAYYCDACYVELFITPEVTE